LNKTKYIGSIGGMLKLWSLKERELEYQKQNPESNVAFKLFSQWKDYYNPESKEFNEFYRIEEKEKLKEFNFELIGFSDKILSNLPKIEEFVEIKCLGKRIS